MARDAGGGDRFVFDLVDDEPADDEAFAAAGPATGDGAGGAVGGARPEAGEPTSGGVRQLRLRALAPVAAVLAVALGTGNAVDGVRDADRIERAREMSGGVVDVSRPLEETWAWEGAIGADEGADMMVADLQGVLAFQYAGELMALDPASGEEAWSVPLGAEPECGPVGYPGMGRPATLSMVCLQGGATDREAITVGPDGVASAPRGLDPADDRRYGRAHPGPEGTVLRARRVGPASSVDVGDARCVETTGECHGTVEAGRDLLLRAEDAITGEERWSVTVPFRETDAQNCTPWFGNPWNGWDGGPADVALAPDGAALAPDAFGAQIGAELVEIWGCGVWAAVTPEGALLRADGTSEAGTASSLGGGRYALLTLPGPGEVTARTSLLASDGTLLGEIPEYVSSPQTADGLDETTLFAVSRSGSRLRSYAADGSLRWDVAAQPESGAPEFLAQVDGTLVVSSWTGSFWGLDVATGERRWTWEPGEALDDSSYEVGYVPRAFTDGRSVLLPLQNDEGAVRLASVDVTSGELGWTRALADVVGPQQNVSLLSVGGSLLAVTPRGVVGLG
jgi:outer membrane protein assembly factor BamB